MNKQPSVSSKLKKRKTFLKDEQINSNDLEAAAGSVSLPRWKRLPASDENKVISKKKKKFF